MQQTIKEHTARPLYNLFYFIFALQDNKLHWSFHRKAVPEHFVSGHGVPEGIYKEPHFLSTSFIHAFLLFTYLLPLMASFLKSHPRASVLYLLWLELKQTCKVITGRRYESTVTLCEKWLQCLTKGEAAGERRSSSSRSDWAGYTGNTSSRL